MLLYIYFNLEALQCVTSLSHNRLQQEIDPLQRGFVTHLFWVLSSLFTAM